ncbi:MAG: hypothetical protein M3P06_11720 [Acidobacteriota bacterium]|nr:hypothetical protein [Acidobacteriota bacterium]
MCLILLLFTSFTILAGTTVEIHEPVSLIASDVIARGWLSFAGLPPTVDGPLTTLAFESEPPAERARADVLVRRSGRWHVISSAMLTSDRRVAVPRDERAALLVRFERTPAIYAWADAERMDDRVVLKLARNVRVEPIPEGAVEAILFASEAIPLTRDDEVLRAVPLVGGLFCVGEACALGSSSADAITLRAKDNTRVLRTAGDANEVQVLVPGRLELLPIAVATSIVRSGAWSAVALPAGVAWDDVVVDIFSDGAKQRLNGAGLLPLPLWTDVHVVAEKGVVVRPLIGPEKLAHGDAAAMLYVFPAEAGDGLKIPLATAKLEDGAFKLPEIGLGRYRLKLFSPEATGEPVTASLTPGVPADVVFARGPVIRGRVVRRGGGSPDDSISIEIIRQTVVADASAIADWMRNADAELDGSFRIMLTASGPYRLRARWGTAQGEVDFEVKDLKKDVDLGEISLAAGASLRGTLPGCTDGELRMTPLPDLTKPMTVPFFDYRRIPVAANGTFMAEGLSRGEWVISARCGGAAIEVSPSLVAIPDSGIVFLDLRSAVGR